MLKRIPTRFALALALMVGGALFAEPALRTGQTANAEQWQLYWGNEYDSCEGCCDVGFCCTINAKCSYKIQT
jgi:hypothetical protein